MGGLPLAAKDLRHELGKLGWVHPWLKFLGFFRRQKSPRDAKNSAVWITNTHECMQDDTKRRDGRSSPCSIYER